MMIDGVCVVDLSMESVLGGAQGMDAVALMQMIRKQKKQKKKQEAASKNKKQQQRSSPSP